MNRIMNIPTIQGRLRPQDSKDQQCWWIIHFCEECKIINLCTVYCCDSISSIQNGSVWIPVALAVPPTIQLIFARFLFLLCVVCTAETFSWCCCGSVDGAAVHLSR